ncbi:hypothetical protein BDY17DRAFT_315882 [Neohortaea acidophila]|uniref:Zn(2)-C6 fungal-type domain-containing protein n=1 Tax=Neohortaea acidophila TaxID=245834 RepID=A0A6A6Q0Q6_9PEZI|nr:uncharacterized protein BDY17DRAFT_315882 [Neohortaea acidophila]KAF2485574.1 hypothetical protein BDY17DRAFT_315882 [Neohortaea acidophila]
MPHPAADTAPRPAALACAQCRSRHLKCDGGRPVCRRCAVEGCECHYTPSRRGQRRRVQRRSSHGNGSATASVAGDDISPSTAQPWTNQPWPGMDVLPAIHPLPPDGLLEQNLPLGDHDSTLTELYFTNFHHSHPVLPPKIAYKALPVPECLRAVVRFIASILASSPAVDTYKDAACAALKEDLSWTAFRVQAQLLFAIALYSTNEQAEAQKYLQNAVDLACLLGMNRAGHQLLEESFRRTWWELFIIEGMFAALQKQASFRCNTVELGAGLPCEDPTFLSGVNLPKAPTLAQFDNRVFEDEDISFSSYCYRIEAVRILARVLAVAEDPDVEKDEFTAVDNALAGWRYHLPQCKADIARSQNAGEPDELMFQAYLIINNATIMLHLPRSNLRSIHPLTTDTTCCPWSRPLAPTFSQHNHLMKVTAASQGLSDLAALRCAHDHTPFLASGLIVASLVQLSICSLHASHCITQHRERVMLMIGVLKSLGRIWPLAQSGLTQVRSHAKEVLQRPLDTTAAGSLDPAGEEAANGEFTQIDISWMDDLLQNPASSVVHGAHLQQQQHSNQLPHHPQQQQHSHQLHPPHHQHPPLMMGQPSQHLSTATTPLTYDSFLDM